MKKRVENFKWMLTWSVLFLALATVFMIAFHEEASLGPGVYVCNVNLLAGTNCYGDVDGNGFVNAGDRGFISANIGQTAFDLICKFDLDGNGVINAGDRGFVATNIGLCTPLPDYQDGSGLNHGVSDTRFLGGENAECGDDSIQRPNNAGLDEVCDGIDLDGNNCEDFGFDGGALSCSVNCREFDVSRCDYLRQKKQFILIGVDGMQNAHLETMFANGELPNIAQLISMGGRTTARITHHDNTATMPGNSELHTGLGADVTGIANNRQCNNPNAPIMVIPDGLTTFERLKMADSEIVTGSVYGKDTCYIPQSLLNNALPEIDFFFRNIDYPSIRWADGSPKCVAAISAANKAREFISQNAKNSFYLVVYFGEPDCSGHFAGDNSENYNAAFRSVDAGVGELLDAASDYGITGNVGIMLSADHGWNEGTTGHATDNDDTRIIPLLANRAELIASATSEDGREQCEIAPTIMDFMGIPEFYYQDVLDYGCESMLG